MKIGIITRHSISNYGSLLQSYATQEAIKKLNHESIIIDYVREEEKDENLVETFLKYSKKFNSNFFTRVLYRIFQSNNISKMNSAFKKYRDKYLRMTNIQFSSLKELKKYNFDIDIFCTGSDQVWGKIGNVEYDPNYFLEFVAKNSKCITYAASFGKNDITTNLKQNLPKYLEKYKDGILVRESSAIDIIKESGYKKNVDLVLDPTLLLSKDDWKKIINQKCNNGKKYILVYQLHHNKKFDLYVKNMKKITGLEVFRISPSIYYRFKPGKLIYLPTIEEFLEYFNNAEYVLTDSFHGTVFSIIFNKKVIDILPSVTGTRIESLLNLFDIKDRIITNYNDFSILNKEIDYNKVNKILEEQRNNSLKKLQKVIENE